MRILFCNIAWMKYYNGITDDDKPENGGSWVKENGNATECLNFAPCNDGTYCGYVSTKSNRGNSNQLHIEKLEGKIIITDDIGMGIVPIEKRDRMWRDIHGKCIQYISLNCIKVIRIFFGIEKVLKNEED